MSTSIILERNVSYDLRMRESLSVIKPLAICACGHPYEDHKVKLPHRCGDCNCAEFQRPKGGVFHPRPTRTKVTIERVEEAARLVSLRWNSSELTSKRKSVQVIIHTCPAIYKKGKKAGQICGAKIAANQKVCGNHKHNQNFQL